jgi:hypothetical protein
MEALARATSTDPFERIVLSMSRILHRVLDPLQIARGPEGPTLPRLNEATLCAARLDSALPGSFSPCRYCEASSSHDSLYFIA